MLNNFMHFKSPFGTDYYVNPYSIVYICGLNGRPDTSFIRLNGESTSIEVKGKVEDIAYNIDYFINTGNRMGNKHAQEEIQGKSYN